MWFDNNPMASNPWCGDFGDEVWRCWTPESIQSLAATRGVDDRGTQCRPILPVERAPADEAVVAEGRKTAADGVQLGGGGVLVGGVPLGIHQPDLLKCGGAGEVRVCGFGSCLVAPRGGEQRKVGGVGLGFPPEHFPYPPDNFPGMKTCREGLVLNEIFHHSDMVRKRWEKTDKKTKIPHPLTSKESDF